MNAAEKLPRRSFARHRSPDAHRQRLIQKIVSNMTERNQRTRQRWLEANRPVEPKESFLEFSSVPNRHDQREQWQAYIHRAVWETIKGNSGFVPDENKTWKEYAAEVLSAQTRLEIENLKWIVQERYPNAIEALAALALDTAKTLNRLALNESHTSRLRGFARKQIAWPVFKSPHRYFSQEESLYFNALEVGADDPRKIEQFARWNPNDEAGKLALESYDEINRARQYPILILLQGSACPAWKRAALNLPPFSQEKQVVLKWFNVAKEYFQLHSEKLDLLQIPASKRKTAGISSHAFTILREKYLSMAGFNKT
jgi:hypothetical protein